MNLREFNILFITYAKKKSEIVQKDHFSMARLLYYANVYIAQMTSRQSDITLV